MPYYRLYFFDGDSPKITAVEELHAADDDAAVALCEAHRGPQPMELWCEARKVSVFEAVPGSARKSHRQRD